MKRNIILTVILLISFSSLIAADWTKWRGPEANGISKETNWNYKILLTQPKILWESNVNKGHSAVAVKDGLLYTMGATETGAGEEKFIEDIVYCLNAETGEEVWRYAYQSKGIAFPGPRATPVLDGNFVYTLSWEGLVLCFNAQSGNVIWKRNIFDDAGGKRHERGYCGSPVVEGDLLILTACESGLALNKKNGNLVWKSEPAKNSLASPVVFFYKGKRVAAIMNEKRLHIVDVKDGAVLRTISGSETADPNLWGEKMYLPFGKLVDLTGDSLSTIWENKDANTSFQGNVIINGYGYQLARIKGKQKLICVDLKTGDIAWRENLGDWGGLMAADGKLIIADGEGNLIVAEASPEAFKPIVNINVLQMPDNKNIKGEDRCYLWTTPVLVNGLIYVRNTWGDLVCVDVRM